MCVRDVYINTTTNVPEEATEFDLELFERFMSGGPWVAHSEYMKLMTENARMRELIAQAIDWYRRIGDHGEHTQCHKCPIEPTCGGGKCMFPDYIIANATEIGVMG